MTYCPYSSSVLKLDTLVLYVLMLFLVCPSYRNVLYRLHTVLYSVLTTRIILNIRTVASLPQGITHELHATRLEYCVREISDEAAVCGLVSRSILSDNESLCHAA